MLWSLNALVIERAQVSGNAQVFGDALVFDRARVSGDDLISGDAEVSGNAEVGDDVKEDMFIEMNGKRFLSIFLFTLLVSLVYFAILAYVFF